MKIIPAIEIMSVALLDDTNFAVFTSSVNHHFKSDSRADAESWVSRLKEVGRRAAEGVISLQRKEGPRAATALATAARHVMPKNPIPIVVDNVEVPYSYLHSYSNHPHSPHMEVSSHTEYSGDDVFSSQSEWDDQEHAPLAVNTNVCKYGPITGPSPITPGDDSHNHVAVAPAAVPVAPINTTNTPAATPVATPIAGSRTPSYGSPHTHSHSASPGNAIHVNTASSPNHSYATSPVTPSHPLTPTNIALSRTPTTIAEGSVLRLKKRYNQWQRQYAILTGDSMSFYKSLNSSRTKKPTKVIPISQLLDVVELDPLSKSKPFCMQLITPQKRIRFSLDTEADLTKWLVAIKSIARDDFTGMGKK